MNSYMLILWNIARMLVLKMRYISRFHFSWIERIHPSVRINLHNNSRISIGRNIEIADDSELLCFGNAELVVGDGCYFNRRLMISCHAGVTIGSRCLFGPDVKIFDNNHVFTNVEGVSTDLRCAPISIGDNCWIASNVVILKGAILGDGCVIGAGCIVSGLIPPHSIMKHTKDSFEIQNIL